MFFLPKENFDIDAGDGDGGGHLGPPKSPKIIKKQFVRKLFTLLGHLSQNVKKYL